MGRFTIRTTHPEAENAVYMATTSKLKVSSSELKNYKFKQKSSIKANKLLFKDYFSVDCFLMECFKWVACL